MLDLILGPARKATAMGDNDSWFHWLESVGRKTKAGVRVNEEAALTFSACWCATRVISETIAMLPLLLYEKQKGDSREFATEHPLYDLLKVAPNPEMGSMAWREGRLHHQVNYGNAFSEIEWDNVRPERRTRVIGLHPIHPTRVQPICETTYPNEYAEGFRYRVNNDDGSQVVMRGDEMLHVPGPISEDGIWGKGVIQYARESIGACLATEAHVASSFGDNSMPGAVVILPGMKDPGVRKQFRSEWKEIHGGPNGDRLAILPPEGQFHALGQFNNHDAEFLANRQHNIEEICRWYRVYPHMIMHLLRSTNNNIEHQGIEAVVYSFMPWIRRWEEQINLKCLLPRERKKYYAEHQLAGLLRGDITSRFAAYTTALQNGFMSINECRRLENLNPVDGGDKHFVQMNLIELGRAGDPNANEQNPSSVATGKIPKDDDEMAFAMESLAAKLIQATESQSKAMVNAVQAIPVPNIVVQPATAEVKVASPNVHVLANVDVPATTVNVAAPNVSIIAPVDVQVPTPTAAAPEPSESAQQQSLPRDAIQGVLEDTLGRMLFREGSAALAKMKAPAFDVWLEEFHRDHRDRLLESLPPAVRLLQLLASDEVDVGQVADHVLSSSRSRLLRAYEEDTRKQFEARLKGWSGLSKEYAEEIMSAFAGE